MSTTGGNTPGIATWSLGDVTVTALSDGAFAGSLDLVRNIPAETAADLQAASFRDLPPVISLNAFLIRGRGAPVLVDTGMGKGGGPTLGRLPAALAAAGVKPDEIGTVLLTHLHPDHVGGLSDDGRALFPNAEIAFSEGEAKHWLDEGALSRAPEAAKPYFQGAQAAVAPYASKTRTFAVDAEVGPGIRAVPEPGHTPGHCGFLVEGSEHRLLIWGDIVHLPGIQFAEPLAGVAFDVDGQQAVETRRGIMDRAASERLLVAGMHLEFPALGHLERTGAGYRWQPALWVP